MNFSPSIQSDLTPRPVTLFERPLTLPFVYENLPDPVKTSYFFTPRLYENFIASLRDILKAEQRKKDASNTEITIQFKIRPLVRYSKRKDPKKPLPDYVYTLEGIPGSIYCDFRVKGEETREVVILSTNFLGKGSYGSVKKVLSLHSGQSYSAKISIIYRDWRFNPAAEEAKNLAVLKRFFSDLLFSQGPNRSKGDEKYIIISDYTDGVPLTKLRPTQKINLLSSEASLPKEHYDLNFLITISLKCVEALHDLHATNQMRHNDISPNNIIIGPSNLLDLICKSESTPATLTATLIDFGSALEINQQSSDYVCTYAAPEIDAEYNANPNKRTLLPYTFESDVYSLGATLRFLCFNFICLNKSQFEDESMLSHFKLDASYPSPINRYFHLMNCMLAKQPHDRPTLDQAKRCLTNILEELAFLEKKHKVENFQTQHKITELLSQEENALVQKAPITTEVLPPPSNPMASLYNPLQQARASQLEEAPPARNTALVCMPSSLRNKLR